MKRGKNYRAALEKYNKQDLYAPEAAMGLVKELSFAKFDETVELSVKLDRKSVV